MKIVKVPAKEAEFLATNYAQNTMFVLYLWQNCGACKRFMPIFLEAMKSINNQPQVTIYEVDFDSDRATVLKETSGFPTLLKYKNKQKSKFDLSKTSAESVRAFLME